MADRRPFLALSPHRRHHHPARPRRPWNRPETRSQLDSPVSRTREAVISCPYLQRTPTSLATAGSARQSRTEPWAVILCLSVQMSLRFHRAKVVSSHLARQGLLRLPPRLPAAGAPAPPPTGERTDTPPSTTGAHTGDYETEGCTGQMPPGPEGLLFRPRCAAVKRQHFSSAILDEPVNRSLSCTQKSKVKHLNRHSHEITVKELSCPHRTPHSRRSAYG